jgi:hypothetical protein
VQWTATLVLLPLWVGVAVALRERVVRPLQTISNMLAALREIPGVAGFVGGWTLFHDVLPKVNGAVTSDAVRSAAMAVDIPSGGEINGAGMQFAPPGSPDAGQNLRAAAVVGQWQAGGVMRVVYPDAYATGRAILPMIP